VKITIEFEDQPGTMALHQSWIDGIDNETGKGFSLSCGAGLGNPFLFFSIGDAHYVADARELVKALIEAHEARVCEANPSIPDRVEELEGGLVEAIAMALYIYNVAPVERATKLYAHFAGACAEIDELVRLVDSAYWATEMAFPTARAYLLQAMARYGTEAARRVIANSFCCEEES
jgi:hypothetical protein